MIEPFHHSWVRANSPISVGPQCATVSASITPGASGASSAQVRMVVEFHRCNLFLARDTRLAS
ncbi:hypothetical protein AWC08_16275 [Mycobacterium gordonae]|uniref:Uncharacterized protein n=1 Tax=Mycobacterium gordonae TaxID=1778 RepID=A0A1X1X813_MYCGO|nr:hypothetical protein AWC08_16275 [Mycobacterium gordonae]